MYVFSIYLQLENDLKVKIVKDIPYPTQLHQQACHSRSTQVSQAPTSFPLPGKQYPCEYHAKTILTDEGNQGMGIGDKIIAETTRFRKSFNSKTKNKNLRETLLKQIIVENKNP